MYFHRSAMVTNFLHDSITKAHCVMVYFNLNACYFVYAKFFFVSGNSNGKLDPHVCIIASKSFPAQKSAFSDETSWLKKLNVWSSLFDRLFGF